MMTIINSFLNWLLVPFGFLCYPPHLILWNKFYAYIELHRYLILITYHKYGWQISIEIILALLMQNLGLFQREAKFG